MTWYRRSLSIRTHTVATCAESGCSPRAAWSSHHSGCGGKVAQLCLANRPILTRSVWSVTEPACPVNRPPLSRLRLPGWTGQKAMTDEDCQMLCGLRRMTEACGEFCAGVIGNDLSRDDQLAISTRLADMAECIRDRALRTPVVIEGEAV